MRFLTEPRKVSGLPSRKIGVAKTGPAAKRWAADDSTPMGRGEQETATGRRKRVPYSNTGPLARARERTDLRNCNPWGN